MARQYPPQFIGRPAAVLGCFIWFGIAYALSGPVIRFFQWLL